MVRTDEIASIKKAVKSGVTVFVVFVIILLTITFLMGGLYNVDEGEVGVKFIKFGGNKGFQANEYVQGYGLKTPFRDRMITVPFRTQTIYFTQNPERGEYPHIEPKDKNGINFKVDITVRYRLDSTQASEFIEQKGEGLPALETIMTTAIRADSTRGIFGQYNQEDIPIERITIAKEIKKVLQERINLEATGKLKLNFIQIESVDIRNVQFDPRIEEAIVNKQTQKQEAEKREYILQQAQMDKQIAIVNAEKQKEAQIIVAEGNNKAIILEAEAKAKGIQLVNDAYQSMPKEYVLTKFAEAIRPTDKVYLGFDSLGGNTLNFLNLNEATGLIHEQQK